MPWSGVSSASPRETAARAGCQAHPISADGQGCLPGPDAQRGPGRGWEHTGMTGFLFASLVLLNVPRVGVRLSPPATPVMLFAKICQNPCPVKSSHAEMLKQASKEQARSQKRGRNVV